MLKLMAAPVVGTGGYFLLVTRSKDRGWRNFPTDLWKGTVVVRQFHRNVLGNSVQLLKPGNFLPSFTG